MVKDEMRSILHSSVSAIVCTKSPDYTLSHANVDPQWHI